MPKHVYFSTLLGSILFAIWTMTVLRDFTLSALFLCFVFCLGILITYSYRQYRFILFFSLLWVLLWFLYTHIYLESVKSKQEQILPYIWSYISQQGRVVELYRRQDYYDEYILEWEVLSNISLSKNIFYILRVPKNFELDVWERISYTWKLYELKDFNGFAYKDFMLSKGIYFSTSLSNFESLENPLSGWKYHITSYRNTLLWRIWDIFPRSEAIFLGGILLWARENIPAELREDFNNSGLTHFIAVSGFNITLCVIFTTFLFGFLPIYFRIFMVSSVIVLFSLFVGLWAPVVRAAIMGILWYIFLQSGQNTRNIPLLLFTALCMVLYSPLALMYDVSLHLSFLAVIWIIYTQEVFTKLCSFLPSTLAIREAFVLTLAALSFSLPIMMFQFGQVSLLAPFANIAVTWTIPIAMLLWALTLIIDFFSSFLAQGIWFITWILLHYDMQMVAFFGNLEFSLIRMNFGTYKNYLQAWYFILLIYFLVLYHRKYKK